MTKAKEKPVVKYQTRKFKFAGKMHTIRSKLTLLASFNGELAKRLADASNDGNLEWSYYDTKGNEKLEIYEDKTLWTKP